MKNISLAANVVMLTRGAPKKLLGAVKEGGKLNSNKCMLAGWFSATLQAAPLLAACEPRRWAHRRPDVDGETLRIAVCRDQHHPIGELNFVFVDPF